LIPVTADASLPRRRRRRSKPKTALFGVAIWEQKVEILFAPRNIWKMRKKSHMLAAKSRSAGE